MSAVPGKLISFVMPVREPNMKRMGREFIIFVQQYLHEGLFIISLDELVIILT